MGNGVSDDPDYVIGVDGGGTGTRVVIATSDGRELARGAAGPSALRYGADAAWAAILQALTQAFSSLGLPVPALADMAIGLGLAGVHNAQWATQFVEKNPGFGMIMLETDARTTLLGAHQGRPGGIVAIGTGSVGEAMLEDGSRREVGGWGFPCGDEAGGAWLGLRAVNVMQHVLDGRCQPGRFATAIMRACGGVDSDNSHDGIFAWLAAADQSHYAQLAPIVVAWGKRDAMAGRILQQAGLEIAKIALALDPTESIPIALCGGLAEAMTPYVPEDLQQRLVMPVTDSVGGALILIVEHLMRLIRNPGALKE